MWKWKRVTCCLRLGSQSTSIYSSRRRKTNFVPQYNFEKMSYSPEKLLPKSVEWLLDAVCWQPKAHRQALEHYGYSKPGHLCLGAWVHMSPGQLCRSETPVPMHLKWHQSVWGLNSNSYDFSFRPKIWIPLMSWFRPLGLLILFALCVSIEELLW